MTETEKKIENGLIELQKYCENRDNLNKNTYKFDKCNGCYFESSCPEIDCCVPDTWKIRPNSENKLTNADKIRSMSDEELAKFLVEVTGRYYEKGQLYEQGEDDMKPCRKCSLYNTGDCDETKFVKEWLSQEVEDGFDKG